MREFDATDCEKHKIACKTHINFARLKFLLKNDDTKWHRRSPYGAYYTYHIS